MAPKGTVLIIGGAEDKGEEEKDIQQRNIEYEKFEILRELLPKSGLKERIEIITSASRAPDEVAKTYTAAFERIGFTDIGFMDIKWQDDENNPDYIRRIHNAHAVFFSGGDQLKLVTTIAGSEVIELIKEKYYDNEDFVVAGTSAGAMAMSNYMIYKAGVHEGLLKDDVKIIEGIGIIDGCIIDTHFIKRGRFGRLAHAVTMNPDALGVGLGEDTALIIKNGHQAECRGSGMVVIIDGTQIERTNIRDIGGSAPVFVENLKVHLLARGCRFSTEDRKMIHENKGHNKSKTLA